MRATAAIVPLTDEQRAFAARPEHLKLCRFAARKFGRKCPAIPPMDFYQAAFEGLADAVRLYDPARGVFESFAPRRVEGACLDLMRDGGLVRVPRRGRGEVPRVLSIDSGSGWKQFGSDMAPSGAASADSLHPLDPSPPPGDALESAEGFATLLGDLPAVERFVVRKRFGPDPWPVGTIADHLGLSESRVAQVQAAALDRVAKRAIGLGLARPEDQARFAHATRASRARGGRCGPRFHSSLPCPREDMHDHLARLTPRQAAAISLRYGLDDGRERSVEQVARELGLGSPQVASYTIKVGLAKVAGMVREADEPKETA